ncbi:MAG: MFS transporter [Clostridia bacterium]|nr:MFS transporter [Clostridia bacterium]
MRKIRIHYGWLVTLGCGCMLFYSIGLAYNCMSLFIDPLMEQYGLSKTLGSLIVNMQLAGGLCAMVVTGKLINRFGARKISFIAGLVIASGYLIFSTAEKSIICYIAAFVVGLGYGSGSMIPVSTLLTVWFDKKRGFALGAATMGSGIATIISPKFLTNIIEQSGVEYAFLFLSIVVATMATFSFVLIRNIPRDKGLLPYGYVASESNIMTEETGITINEALKMIEYYLLAIVAILLGLTVMPLVTHISPIIIQSGYSPGLAASMLSLYGIGMLVSKPLYGVVIDQLGVSKSNTVIYSFLLASLCCGLFIDKGQVLPYLFVILFGIGVPVNTIALPIWVAAIFGKKDMANIYSSIKILFTIGAVLGGSLPGIIADLRGTYLPVFIIYIALVIVSYIIVQYLFSAGLQIRRHT